jgi:hypothetical protein
MNENQVKKLYFEDDTHELPVELLNLPPEELDRVAEEVLKETKDDFPKRLLDERTLRVFSETLVKK